ncbi:MULTISPECIES: hypothetical protein [Bacillus]|uniref:Uncharacterized protein n=1 Tax=Bacillus sonorensis TaxID=119858 RepID=A0ABN5ARN7_9BACI|nr:MULTISPECIES: hypothetical protein [Bacillus]ASB90845.1 hypothetical protein S101395_04343 [Bacillus sonorensis]MDI3409715.1 hypothetical protein [Bacillus sonorensis]MDI3410044.1 hypothetical protein [Bacillus sonorensis]MDR4958169.1 hypothetical protein [Bacillus sonorensis]MEC0340061.1 hypothetical protein [Bacillus sonorensis]
MKILVVKYNGLITSDEQREKIREEARKAIERGVFVCDEMVSVDSVDIEEKENSSYSASPIGFVKPPIGVKPRFIHDEQRAEELSGAIMRYIQANKSIPTEWLEEYNELVGNEN